MNDGSCPSGGPRPRAVQLRTFLVLGLCAMGCSCGIDVSLGSAADGTGWQGVGSSATGGGVSDHGSTVRCKLLAISSDGTVDVIWTDPSSGKAAVYLRTWDGAAWTEVGESGSGAGVSQGTPAAMEPSPDFTCSSGIDFDATGAPYVSWQNTLSAGDQPSYLRHWDGSTWAELDSSASGAGLSAQIGATWIPAIASDGVGKPVVSWENGGDIYVARDQGMGWTMLGDSLTQPGGISGGPGDDTFQRVALDKASGDIFVSWQSDVSGISNIYLLRWSGSAWAGLADSDSSDGLSQSASAAAMGSLVVDPSDRPIVCWSEDPTGASPGVHVSGWDGSAWGLISASSLVAAGIASASARNCWLAVTPDGAPVVAWTQDDSTGSNIHVARWSTDAWVDLAPLPGAVSETSVGADWAALAVDAQSVIWVAWEQGTPSGSEVYLKALR